MGAVIAAAAMAADRRLVERLRSRRAISAEQAQPVDAAPGLERRRLARLVARGIIVEAAAGTYYLIEAAWTRHLETGRRQLAVVLLLAMVITGVVFLMRGR